VALQELLGRIAGAVDGMLGVALVGLDGILVAQASRRPGFDLNVVGAEYATIVKEARRAFESLGEEPMQEILVSTEQANLLLARVGKEYFVVLAIEASGNLGRGRLELKRALPELEREV